jgi:hypothetical protein
MSPEYKDEPLMPLHSLCRLLASAAFAALLCACAHPSTTHSQQDPKQGTTMATPAAQSPGGKTTIHDYSELTADEVGQRFLRLVDSLGTEGSLTLDKVQPAIRLPLRHSVTASNEQLYSFDASLTSSGNSIHFQFRFGGKNTRRGAHYEIGAPLHSRVDETSQDSPRCVIDLDSYRKELISRGFTEGIPIIDGLKNGDEYLLGYPFDRGGTGVMLTPAPRLNHDATHECLQNIMVTSANP